MDRDSAILLRDSQQSVFIDLFFLELVFSSEQPSNLLPWVENVYKPDNCVVDLSRGKSWGEELEGLTLFSV